MSQRPPGPVPSFLLGNLRAFAADPLNFLVESARDYGDIVYFRLLRQPYYLMAHPDWAREVLVTRARHFHKANLDINILSRVLGQGLLTSEEPLHGRQRRLMQPAFHSQRIESYARTMVTYTGRLLQAWRDGQTRAIDQDMTALTMFIVAKSLFDADMAAGAGGGNGERPAVSTAGMAGVTDAAARVGSAIQVVQEVSNNDYFRGFPLPAWLPSGDNRRRRQATAVIDDTLSGIITARRASAANGQVVDTGDLLSMLLLARDEAGQPMADRQLRDETVTLFSAGHETTANALTWIWYLLAQNPEAEAKLHQEVDAVLAGRLPTAADLARLPYTEMVVKEALRLYPPAWVLNGRLVVEPLTVGGYELPRGAVVFISPYQLHRRPDFFPEPERFAPERFTPEREKALPRYAYMPFGAGPRVCIGNSFAMMEAQLILATIASRFSLRLEARTAVAMAPQITLSARDGLRLRIAERLVTGN